MNHPNNEGCELDSERAISQTLFLLIVEQVDEPIQHDILD